MKKLALTIGCVVAVTGAAFAQGTLAWNSISPAGMTVQLNGNLSPLFGGSSSVSGTFLGTAASSYYFELLYNTAFTGSQTASPTLAALTGGSWIDSGLQAVNSTASAGKLTVLGSTTSAAISGWAGGIGALGGTTNNVVLVGWSSNLGTTWSAVRNVLATWDDSFAASFGVSATGYLVPNQGNPGATVFAAAANANGLPIFSVNTQLYALPVPEPATFALAGLGGLAMLMFRRRK